MILKWRYIPKYSVRFIRALSLIQQLAKKYDIPEDMVSGIYKKTKKGCVLMVD